MSDFIGEILLTLTDGALGLNRLEFSGPVNTRRRSPPCDSLVRLPLVQSSCLSPRRELIFWKGTSAG
ncbi:MAG: hypothetical protein HRU46_18955 [Verrucomicrobiales bacterium]|nr:hypothetical protein [Verrucomicrobiales bacterium]